MTHFGGVGTMEAIWTAVPMVGMALEGDQGQRHFRINLNWCLHWFFVECLTNERQRKPPSDDHWTSGGEQGNRKGHRFGRRPYGRDLWGHNWCATKLQVRVFCLFNVFSPHHYTSLQVQGQYQEDVPTPTPIWKPTGKGSEVGGVCQADWRGYASKASRKASTFYST